MRRTPINMLSPCTRLSELCTPPGIMKSGGSRDNIGGSDVGVAERQRYLVDKTIVAQSNDARVARDPEPSSH